MATKAGATAAVPAGAAVLVLVLVGAMAAVVGVTVAVVGATVGTAAGERRQFGGQLIAAGSARR